MLKFDFLEKFLGLVSPPHFVYVFSRKFIIMLYSINWSNFIVWLCFPFQIWRNMSIKTVCNSGSDFINFENNLIFLDQVVFLHGQKVKTKIWISRKQKYFLTWNKKHFSWFSNGFHLPRIVLECAIKFCNSNSLLFEYLVEIYLWSTKF